MSHSFVCQPDDWPFSPFSPGGGHRLSIDPPGSPQHAYSPHKLGLHSDNDKFAGDRDRGEGEKEKEKDKNGKRKSSTGDKGEKGEKDKEKRASSKFTFSIKAHSPPGGPTHASASDAVLVHVEPTPEAKDGRF